MELYKTGLYCRLSQDDGQEGDSSSIQTQKIMLEKFAKENGFVIHDFYVDDGYSGLNFDRPDFQRMLNDIDAGKINMVITKDLSRLGRDYIMTGYYTEIYFSNKNIRYIAINDNIDTIKDNNDIAPFKNILNDMYAKDISRKIKSAKRQRMYQGMYIASQPPYGYKVNPENKNQLVIDDEAAEVVREIYRLALTNIGVVRIVNILNERGIIAPSIYKANHGDNKFIKLVETRRVQFKNYDIETWNAATVGKILRDMVYVGDMENHKYEVRNYKTKKCTRVPDDEHIIVRNTHEAIISREDFAKVQEMIKNRQRPSRHNHPNIFKGIIKCQNCGRTFTLYYNERRTGKLVWRYKCMGKYLKHGKDTELNSIGYDEIYEIVFARLRTLTESIRNQGDRYIENLVEKTDTKSKTQKLEIEKSKISKRLNVIGKVVKRLYEDYVGGDLTDGNYQEMLSEYQAEQKKLNQRLAEIQAVMNASTDRKEKIKKFKSIATQYLDFEILTSELVNNLIDHIEVGLPKETDGRITREINIVYRFLG